MATIIHREELVRRALAYLLERKKEKPSMGMSELLDDAGIRFNLSPLDQEALERLLGSQTGGVLA